MANISSFVFLSHDVLDAFTWLFCNATLLFLNFDSDYEMHDDLVFFCLEISCDEM